MRRLPLQSILGLLFSLFVVNFLTAARVNPNLSLPPCPKGSEREYVPNQTQPLWIGCKDKNGLYQGLLLQLTSSQEIIRIAGVQNSERHGREIRLGNTGFLEERLFKDGHLDGPSFIYQTPLLLGRILPKPMELKDWKNYLNFSPESFLKPLLKQDPISVITFSEGRMIRLQSAGKDYQFQISKDKRIFALNHAEMKGMFFIDPEPLWLMNAADLKAALLPGFGSCKKYAGPIGRFGRHFEHLLYKREASEKAHLERLREIRDRFIQFCVPEDIMSHLGVLECPPQLPSTNTPARCVIPISDQLRVPYQPKYFNFEFTLGRSPEELHEFLKGKTLPQFASAFDQNEKTFTPVPNLLLQLKKSSRGILFKASPMDPKTKRFIVKDKADTTNDWWTWHRVPGY